MFARNAREAAPTPALPPLFGMGVALVLKAGGRNARKASRSRNQWVASLLP